MAAGRFSGFAALSSIQTGFDFFFTFAASCEALFLQNLSGITPP